jgi:hypothetical protein
MLCSLNQQVPDTPIIKLTESFEFLLIIRNCVKLPHEGDSLLPHLARNQIVRFITKERIIVLHNSRVEAKIFAIQDFHNFGVPSLSFVDLDEQAQFLGCLDSSGRAQQL